jgi:hypothetical protein
MPLQSYCKVCLRSVDRPGTCDLESCKGAARQRAGARSGLGWRGELHVGVQLDKEEWVRRHRAGDLLAQGVDFKRMAFDGIGLHVEPVEATAAVRPKKSKAEVDAATDSARTYLERAPSLSDVLAGKAPLWRKLLLVLMGADLDAVGKRISWNRYDGEWDGFFRARLSDVLFGAYPKPNARVWLPREPGGECVAVD